MAKNLQTEKAPLTGESTAVEKSIDPFDEETEIIGRISKMLSEVRSLKTPLMRWLDDLTKLLSIPIVGQVIQPIISLPRTGS